MSIEPGATLIVEIGTSSTRVTLVDAVAGEARLIGQFEVPSTVDLPYNDPGLAFFEAVVRIAESTGRQLMEDNHLLMPQTHERDGVDAVVVVTSAAGPMSLVLAAVASDISARSALHACRSVYTNILQVVTLNDTSDMDSSKENSWVERQVQRLLGLQPDAVVIAGGLEGGANDALIRLAHTVSLTATTSYIDLAGQQQQEVTVRPVIFAGNGECRERVSEALSGRAEMRIVDNVRPTLDVECLEPMRRELLQLYIDRILPSLPGMSELRRLSIAPVRTVCEATGLMTRFIAERNTRNALTLDVGSANTAAYLHSRKRFTPVVMGSVGVGFGVGTVLAERGVEAIARWLPFPMKEENLVHQLLNKLLRPHTVPSTKEDVYIEYAVAREALVMALAALWDERPGAPYDIVIASGNVFSHAPHAGLALLALLDALLPGAEESGGRAIDFHLDTLGLVNACGALAFANADAALTLFEQDLLRNTPLATCIVAQGNGRFGEDAVEAELQVVGGEQKQIVVEHGRIGRLSLPPGRKAQLRLRPIGSVRIGFNAPGDEVKTDVAEISGSALGVVIDARGRPLRLPDEASERQRLIWDWLVALGVETDSFPYDLSPSALEIEIPDVVFASSDSDTSSSSPQTTELETDVITEEDPASIESELAGLRETVEEPKKRGLFGRK
ncbi:MAG: glutamate mutase L [Chloroflexota bacterium]